MVENGGGALITMCVAFSSAAIDHTIYPLLCKDPVDDDTIITVCWLVSIIWNVSVVLWTQFIGQAKLNHSL